MRSRSGVAMLLVMLTIVVMVVGVTIVARVRTTRLLAAQQSTELEQSTQILRESHRVIQTWLKERASSVVLSPSVKAPSIEVLGCSMIVSDQTADLTITAWDQQGMWPRNAEELGFALPFASEHKFTGIPSLEQIEIDGLRYPSAGQPDAFGGLVATHNPWPTRSGQTRTRGTTAINVHTAPFSLLEAIRNRYDVGDFEQLIQQRTSGSFGTFTQSHRDASGSEIRLVSVSRVWSFRVQVTVGLVTRSCWCVYSNQGGQWVLVQRNMIDEATL